MAINLALISDIGGQRCMAIDSKASRRIPQTLLMLDVGTAAHARNTLA